MTQRRCVGEARDWELAARRAMTVQTFYTSSEDGDRCMECTCIVQWILDYSIFISKVCRILLDAMSRWYPHPVMSSPAVSNKIKSKVHWTILIQFQIYLCVLFTLQPAHNLCGQVTPWQDYIQANTNSKRRWSAPEIRVVGYPLSPYALLVRGTALLTRGHEVNSNIIPLNGRANNQLIEQQTKSMS
jgi:hypothetical protein